MGGFGTGLWKTFNRKTAVEDCSILDSAWLAREQAFDPEGCPAAHMVWRDGRDDAELSSVDYFADIKRSLIYLRHDSPDTDEPVAYPVLLTTTELPWGGRRVWFVCPLMTEGIPCRRRVGKLYLPRDGQYYGCRHCYDLTYESCRDSHRWDRLWRMPEDERGMSTREMEEFVDERAWMKRLLERQRRNEQRRLRRQKNLHRRPMPSSPQTVV